MPLKYFIHPETDERLEVKDCLEKGLLNESFPLSYLATCADEREWKGTPSTTQLINGARLEYLKIYCDYGFNPADQAFRVVGTRGHKKLESLTPKSSFAELNIPEQDINMTLDLLEPQPNSEWWLTDYKVVGAYKIMKALGLVKKKRLAVDDYGNPILYKKSGKWGKAGDQKMEDYYEPDPDSVDMKDWILQVNRYRMIAEEYFGIIIAKQKIFAIVRDGGVQKAYGYGIYKNTYYIDVPFMDNEDIKGFFQPRKESFLSHINDCEYELDACSNKIEEHNAIKNNMPEMCNSDENWEGRRCMKYCEVSEFCKMKGDNGYLKERT